MARVETYPTFFIAICDAMRAAWPEVLETATPPGGGIWEVTEGKRISYESMGSTVEDELHPFPRAIIELPPAHEANWGLPHTVFEQPVVCYYADWTEGGESTPYRSKLFLLRKQIQTAGLFVGSEQFTVLPRWGEQVYNAQQRWDESMNDILFVRNNMAQAGGLLFTVLVGDNPA